jgi:NADP-dependent 3-hydroxy acid dehydrogenase YdfG
MGADKIKTIDGHKFTLHSIVPGKSSYAATKTYLTGVTTGLRDSLDARVRTISLGNGLYGIYVAKRW